MSRILAYTSPARGHLFPVVAILDALRDRGHDIAIRTLGSQVELTRGRGFDASSIDPAIETITHDDYLGRNTVDGLRRSVAVFAERAPLDAADLRAAIDETRPDMVLVDINAWGAVAAAQAWGGPWATFCPYLLPIPSRDVPPFGPGLPPARSVAGRLRDRLLRPIVFGSLERTMAPPVNALRTQLGLAPVSGARELYTAAPLCLYLTAEPFEYPRSDWPDSIRMVGPCEWDPPIAMPDWLDRIDVPIVLVTTSSEFQDDGRLAEVAMAALADEDVFVVVTVPSADADGFTAPGNARIESFLPHAPVLDRAVCAVTHGGMGATQKALARGVPVCAVPFGRDQLEVARRVEVAGAGTRLSPKKLSADRLRVAVRNATAQRAGAERVARAYRDAGGPDAAANHVEELLTSTRPSP